ncbi:hypothetical protein [Streptomyces chryseus]
MNKKLTRRVLGTVLPAALVLGAVGGALAYTRHTVGAADVTAPTTVWTEADGEPAKDPAAGVRRGKDSTELSALLLPVPDGYRLGPDIEAHGNDGELGGPEAAALLKEGGPGVSAAKRREYERRVDKMGVRGIAVRSYLSEEDDLVINTQIVRMTDKKYIRDLFTFKAELFRFFDAPEGPKIKQHKKAACYLTPPDSRDGTDNAPDLDGMVCSAYDGELVVTVTAFGPKPFAKSTVAALVKDQLDHIVSPGEYI